MPALVAGIHVFYPTLKKDVDGRNKLALGPAEGRTRVFGHDPQIESRKSGGGHDNVK